MIESILHHLSSKFYLLYSIIYLPPRFLALTSLLSLVLYFFHLWQKKAEKEETPKEKRLSEEVVEQMTKLATSGFGLVAALAWNDAIQSFFNNYFKSFPQNTIYYKFFYAILITLLIVLVTYYLSKLVSKIHRKDENA